MDNVNFNIISNIISSRWECTGEKEENEDEEQQQQQ